MRSIAHDLLDLVGKFSAFTLGCPEARSANVTVWTGERKCIMHLGQTRQSIYRSGPKLSDRLVSRFHRAVKFDAWRALAALNVFALRNFSGPWVAQFILMGKQTLDT